MEVARDGRMEVPVEWKDGMALSATVTPYSFAQKRDSAKVGKNASEILNMSSGFKN